MTQEITELQVEQEHLMQAINCVVGSNVATYISGPITTGPRFIDWYIACGHKIENDSIKYKQIKLDCVLSSNESDIIGAAESLRMNATAPVIEPASLHIASWIQEDYYKFWTELLKRFVSRVVVLDGWQYSIGCVIEFHHAIQCGIRVETFAGKPLNCVDAKKHILEAADDICLRGGSLEVLQRMAQTLRTYAFLIGDISV